jgi:glycosyltransferase involved in cell wall biosynthesis
MKKINIVLVKPSDPRTDPRLIKYINSIKNAGHSVNIICMCKGSETEEFSRTNGRINIVNLNFKGGDNLISLLYWPIWWIFEFYSLFTIKPDIIHIINYNSIFPGLIFGKLSGIPVIYEILDVSYDAIKLSPLIRNFIIYIDKIFMRWSDAVILVDENQIEQFGGIPNNNVNIIYDSALAINDSHISEKADKEGFELLYVGVLHKMRKLNLDKLSQAITDIDGVKLVIAGYGDLVEDIKKWEKESDGKIEYCGRISYTDSLKLSFQADCLVVLRDSTVNTNRYICGSKIWEAMMSGKPIIVNKGTATADKVMKEHCGLVIDANDLSELKQKILQLRDDPDLCETLGKNGKTAYIARYNWDIMENRLLELYNQLLEK